ncbi:MFS transporter [Promicromonospora thailandica]|uniref:MFS transporter n=1 Tax=Promicromonospora thailandica TaxID=765201 RepID=UPI0020A433C1|nr:MFS transporter [Promicromonospora thailandica]
MSGLAGVEADDGAQHGGTSPVRYGLGMFGTSLPINLVKGSMFFVYVDLLGLDAAVYATVYAVYGVLDALDNPVFGYLSDRTRSRWGRRRPYLVVGALVLACTTVALFTVPGPVAESAVGLTVWFALFAITTEMADSLINASYGALLPELFTQERRRATANAVRQGAQLVALVVALALTPVLARSVLGTEGSAVGYGRLAVIFGVVAAVVILWTAFGVREDRALDAEPRPRFFRSVREVLSTPQFWTVGVVNACYGAAMALVLGGLQLYVQYTLEGSALDASILQLVVIAAAIGMLSVWAAVVRRKGAAWTWRLALPVAAAGFVPMYFATDLLTGILGGLAVAVGYSGVLATNDLVIARVLDADAARHGVHRSGLFLAAFGVLGRLNALVTAGAVLSLAVFFGYHSGDDPGPDPAGAFRVYLSLYPFALLLVGTVVSRFIRLPAAPEDASPVMR